MTHVENTSHKQDKHFLFDVELNWTSQQKGTLSSESVDGEIDVATPVLFGGEGRDWSPEHLLLSAVSSCFMTTFLVFAKKFGFEISNFQCNAVGQVRLVEGKYQFTQIDVFPKVALQNESMMTKAKLALEKAEKYCLVSNSINAEVIYHGELLVQAEQEHAVKSSYAIL